MLSYAVCPAAHPAKAPSDTCIGVASADCYFSCAALLARVCRGRLCSVQRTSGRSVHRTSYANDPVAPAGSRDARATSHHHPRGSVLMLLPSRFGFVHPCSGSLVGKGTAAGADRGPESGRPAGRPVAWVRRWRDQRFLASWTGMGRRRRGGSARNCSTDRRRDPGLGPVSQPHIDIIAMLVMVTIIIPAGAAPSKRSSSARSRRCGCAPRTGTRAAVSPRVLHSRWLPGRRLDTRRCRRRPYLRLRQPHRRTRRPPPPTRSCSTST
jgi:hypothetical protein